jgi:RimJ/RimL family protein N-acetyltransferase
VKPCNLLLHADDDVGRWVAARIRGAEEWVLGAGRAIGFTYGLKLIAGVAFFRYNGANVEVAFASENPRWMSRQNLRLLFEYPFRQLRLRRVTAIVDDTNLASRKLIEALGFEYEATLVRASIDGNQLVYRLFAEDCRWLGDADEQRETARSA